MIIPDFDAMHDKMRQRGNADRMIADDGVTPEAGQTYTVSPCFKFGDRSWIDAFWTVLSTSGPNVLVRITDSRRSLTHMVRCDERAWYPADEAFAAFNAEQEGGAE